MLVCLFVRVVSIDERRLSCLLTMFSSFSLSLSLFFFSFVCVYGGLLVFYMFHANATQ